MDIVVLGAGVTGATSAWFLARDGHRVTVIDRQPAAGMETSFANGGQISVSHATPWATPQTPLKALKWLGRDDAPLIFRWFRRDPALWAWGLRFLANCTPSACAHNTRHTVALAMHSRTVLQSLRQELGLSYDALTRGILHIFRDPREYEAQCRSAEIMGRSGLPQDVLTPAAVVALEPALAAAAPQLVGGLYSADDESGDAHRFTQAIARQATAIGVDFQYGTSVHCLETSKSGIAGVVCEQLDPTGQPVSRRFQADAYVLCMGSFSPKIVRSLGFSLPIYPAKGYSMTLPLADNEPNAPTISITDDEHKMVYSRLGNRLRGAGTAELAGWDQQLRQKRAEQIRANAEALFPKAGDYRQATLWCGLRPKTPDSLPYLCQSPVANLYLNTGHGTLGWTMAAGSAQILADLVAGRPTAIDTTGYRLQR